MTTGTQWNALEKHHSMPIVSNIIGVARRLQKHLRDRMPFFESVYVMMAQRSVTRFVCGTARSSHSGRWDILASPPLATPGRAKDRGPGSGALGNRLGTLID